MKRFYLIFIFLFLIFSLFAKTISINEKNLDISITSSGKESEIVDISFGRFRLTPELISEKKYNHIYLENESNLQLKGDPELPTINRSLIIPDDKKMELEIIEYEYKDFEIDVAPSKGEILRSVDPADVPYEFAPVYDQNDFYPSKLAELGSPYILRDFRGILLTVYPFAYNPITGILRVYHHLEFRIFSSGPDEINLKNRIKPGYSLDFESIYHNHFLNFDQGRYDPVEETGRMLVISHEDFLDEIQPYVDWKLQKGIETELFEISDIGDNPTEIKAFIEDEYDSADGLTFVQLVGDAAQIPTFQNGSYGQDPRYSQVDGSDDYPDLFVGRFSGTETEHIETQVERTIYYERDIDPASWMHFALGVASNLGPGDDGENDDEHMDNIRDDLLAYNYTYVGQVYDPGATDDEVADEINAGRGFVNYTGHGSISSWGTSNFNNTDINNLTNNFMLPFICDVACYNGNFVNYTCFAETWLRATHNTFGFPTGAISIYASSISQPWNPPMDAQDEVTDLLVAEDKLTIGGLFFNGACHMMDEYATSANVFEAWNIFGDASLTVRTDTPSSLTVGHPDIIDGNDTSFFVFTGFSGALSCLTDQDNNIIDNGYTGALGWTYLSLPPSRTGYEEYTLTVTACNYDAYQTVIPVYDGNVWLGEFNYYWHNDDNWSYEHIPTVSEKVIITSLGYHPPKVDIYDESCAELDINSGAELRILDQTLIVNGDVTIGGELSMEDVSSQLIVNHDIIWESGSSADIQADNLITVYEDWNFSSGAGVHFDNGMVNFTGTSPSWIRLYDDDCYFNDLESTKNSGGFTKFSNLSTEDTIIKGNLLNYSGSLLGTPSNYDQSIYLEGYFYNESGADFEFLNGFFYFEGVSPYLGLDTSDDFFHELVINTSGTTYVWDDLTVKGSLFILSGQLDLINDDIIIEVGENWDNLVGPSAFVEGMNKVIFNGGNYPQYCSDEDFYRLEINKPSGQTIRIDGTDVSCSKYNWIAGTIEVLSGSFTALDLDQNGIYGAFHLNPGGTIDLSNPDGFVDLNGELHISGGTMNVNEGLDDSYWGFSAPALIEMTDGVLDFKANSIIISTNNDVTENISGGLIRTAGSFKSYVSDFSPVGGKVELTGSNDCVIELSPGSNFFNLNINKPGSRNLEKSFYSTAVLPGENFYLSTGELSSHDIKKNRNPSYTESNQKSILPLESTLDYQDSLKTRTNKVMVNSNLTINNDLTITEGIFDLNGFTIDVINDTYIYGTLRMHDSGSVLNGGTSCYSYVQWLEGSMSDVTAGSFYCYDSMVLGEGSDVQLGTGSTVYFISDCFQSGFWCYDTDASVGNVEINKPAGDFYIAAASTEPLRVSGDFNVNPFNTVDLIDHDLFIQGNLNIDQDAHLFMGSESELVVDEEFHLTGVINIGSGSCLVHGEPEFTSSSTVLINDGSFVCDTPDTGRDFIYVDGILSLVTGLFEFTNNSIYFRTNFKNINGGIIRTGESFCASGTDIFQPSGGSVEIVSDNTYASYLYNNNYFHDLVIESSPGCGTGMFTDFTVKNDLIINQGILYNNSSYDLYLGGDFINNAGEEGFQEGTGTVIFTGPEESNIYQDETFYNLTVEDSDPGGWYTPEVQDNVSITVLNDLYINSGAMALLNNTNLSVTGNIFFGYGAGLNLAAGSDQLFTIGGHWNDVNDFFSDWYGYNPGSSSTTIFNGDSEQFVDAAGAYEYFRDLIIDKPSGCFWPDANLYTFGDLALINGSWEDESYGLNHFISGDFFVDSDCSWESTDQILTFGDQYDQNITFLSATSTLDNIEIDKTPDRRGSLELSESQKFLEKNNPNRSQTVSLQSDFILEGGSVEVKVGKLDLNGYGIDCMGGDITIQTDGELEIDEDAILKIDPGAGLVVNSGGYLNILGSADHPALITRSSDTGYFDFTVAGGATIAAEYGIFQYLDSAGLQIESGAILDPDHSLDFCTFSQGCPVPGSICISFHTSVDHLINNINFPSNNSGCYNVFKDIDSGLITIWDAQGEFAGEEFENDPYDRIIWETTTIPAITNLFISYDSVENCINLMWDYTAEYDNFNIYRDVVPDFIPSTLNQIGSTTATAFSDYDLSGDKYFYKIIVIKE